MLTTRCVPAGDGVHATNPPRLYLPLRCPSPEAKVWPGLEAAVSPDAAVKPGCVSTWCQDSLDSDAPWK